MKVLVLGITGMLGSAVFRQLSERPGDTVVGTCRPGRPLDFLAPPLRQKVIADVDAEKGDALASLFAQVQPDAVINCIGLVKQLATAKDPIAAISVNALLPHMLARHCAATGARLIHVSTDCVFNGKRGGYIEGDLPDADDLYGRSKVLGEVNSANSVTLRTSIIGPEPFGGHGLLEWFLSQKVPVKGYARAVFSGLTTDELARAIAAHVLPHPDLSGVYHVGAAPIDKYRLLNLIKSAYGLPTVIERDESVVIDRSLDSSRFRAATGYRPPEWTQMIGAMSRLHRGSDGAKATHVHG